MNYRFKYLIHFFQACCILVLVTCFGCSNKESDEHEYIDLGLQSGTLWATYNIGASESYEIGNTFAWGETQSKDNYSNENYKFAKITDMKKYNTDDNKEVLELKDDAAYENWGKEWRMPTLTEFNELYESCRWQWVENYQGKEVSGMIGTSKFNGKSIFFPAEKVETYDNTYFFNYWTASKSNCWGNAGEAYAFTAASSYNLPFPRPNLEKCGRVWGFNVRAVRATKGKKKNLPYDFFNAADKDSFILGEKTVTDFKVTGNYDRSTLHISGYFNGETDWLLKSIDTLVYCNVMYIAVRGQKTKWNRSDYPHKSGFFEKDLEITPFINKVVFGREETPLWERNLCVRRNNMSVLYSDLKMIESTDLNPCDYTAFSLGIKKNEHSNLHNRCNLDTSLFVTLVPQEYIYGGIICTCDVNMDGRTDYLLSIEGPYTEEEKEKLRNAETTNDEDEYEEDEEDGNEEEDDENEEEDDENEEEDEENEEEDDGIYFKWKGFILVINKGDHFETDIWNSECFNLFSLVNNENYKMKIIANGKNLSVVFYNENGEDSKNFIYQNGNYQLTSLSFSRNIPSTPIITRLTTIDFEKNILTKKIAKDLFPYKLNLLNEHPGDEYYYQTKWSFIPKQKFVITDISSFN